MAFIFFFALLLRVKTQIARKHCIDLLLSLQCCTLMHFLDSQHTATVRSHGKISRFKKYAIVIALSDLLPEHTNDTNAITSILCGFLWDVLAAISGLSRLAGTSGNPHSAESLLLRKDVEIAFPVELGLFMRPFALVFSDLSSVSRGIDCIDIDN